MNAPDDAAQFRAEPLDITTWLGELGRVMSELNGAAEENAERLLRRAYFLSHLAPASLWALVGSPRTEDAIERELENGVSDRAIAGLINRSLELRTVNQRGLVSAVVGSPGLGVSGRWESRSEAIAVVGAWIQCSLALVELVVADAPASAHNPA